MNVGKDKGYMSCTKEKLKEQTTENFQTPHLTTSSLEIVVCELLTSINVIATTISVAVHQHH